MTRRHTPRTPVFVAGLVGVVALGPAVPVAAEAPAQVLPRDAVAERAKKAPSTISVRARSKRIVARRTKPKFTVRVTVDGRPARGFVKVWTNRRSTQKNLNGRGKATVRMDPYPHAGQKRVRAKFFGDGDTKKSFTVFYVRIQRPRN